MTMDDMDQMDDMTTMDDTTTVDDMTTMDDMDQMDDTDKDMDPLMFQDPMSQMISLQDCEVTTLFTLYVRDGPAGESIGLIPYNTTVPGIARTHNWIKIQYEGDEGWITGHYTTVLGHCY